MSIDSRRLAERCPSAVPIEGFPGQARLSRRRSGVLAWAALGALACALGCRPSQAVLDRPLAQATLQRTLSAWREGQTPQVLGQADPPIIVGEPLWEAGQRLQSFQVLPEATDDGRNLHAQVDLELATPDGQITKRRQTYVVGTSPKLTVFPQ